MVLQKMVYEYGSEFDWESNNKFIDKSKTYPFFQDGDYFRSGRDALRAIALKFKGEYKRVLIPALCCESMVTPFKTNGYEISYFKLNNDISSDFEDVLSKLQPNTIFLYMNYFGIPSLTDTQLNFIRKKLQNIIIIEDRTHDILTKRINKFTPDYTVFSIRKWLAIPDGGIVYSQCKIGEYLKVEDTFFGDIRTDALKIKSEYLKSGNIQNKCLFRDKLQEANSYLDRNESVVVMSAKSYKLLQNIDFKKIYEYRHENIMVYSYYLQKIPRIKSVSSEIEKSCLYYPILVADRDELQNRLAQKNIYCPVIWPLPEKAIGVCEVSDHISRNMLALPCDQRYGKTDIEHICNILEELLENN